ncbi:uncharacterized protein LOC126657009 [Mercurialis annua]|uniref:uncharacterized protein LOC126657009 n=1 Tax=Mercurialis annua TaxID=3986 RepID=UPI002160F4EC|nr:uncharacterized protein LOC126657009 [Mercurialis annua]
MLLEKSVDGKLKRGTTNIVAAKFSVSVRSIQRIWRQAKLSENVVVVHKKTGNCGRKRIEIDLEQIRSIPLHKRTSLESLACSINVSKTRVFSLLKSGVIRRHSNAIKPFLKEENMRVRLQFCISMLDDSSIPRDPIFKEMYNVIHIDEKWFYMTKKSEKYYLLAEEENPLRTCKSKNFIGKVMFLSVIARPRFDSQGNEIFNGKIGLFPFVTQEPARRNSINRAAGTLETKPLTSVNSDIMRSYLIEKLLPKIKEKWPRDDVMNPIFIQQDNARTHVDINDETFCATARQGGFDIRLIAIQSLQYREAPKTVDELISAVERSYELFDVRKSNRIFVSLQLCMIEIMKAKGSNKYKIPHINKARLENLEELPNQLKCDASLVQEVMHYLT